MKLPAWDILSSYEFDIAYYKRLLACRPKFKLKDKFMIQPENGRGFIVKSGQAFRVVEIEGPQIGDVWFYNEDDPKEHFWSNRTFVLEGAYLKRFNRIWSNMPRYRPMATVLEETVSSRGNPKGFRHNTVLGAHCTTEMWEQFSGVKNHNSCYMNALQAIEPFDLKEENIHDNINIHMKCKIEPRTGAIYLNKTGCRKGDYIEFFAEINLLVAVSVCPAGDGKVPMTEPDKIRVRPLGIEIYNTDIEPKPFPKWHDWRPAFREKLRK